MNNTSRLKIYVILAAAVIVVAGLVWFYPRSHSSKVPHVTKSSSSGQTKPARPKPRAISSNEKIPEQQFITDKAPQRLFNAPFQAEMLLLNKDFKLNLTPSELRELQAKYSEVVNKRLSHEADIAQISKTGSNSYEVIIPQYPEGLMFMEEFNETLSSILSNGSKESFVEKIEAFTDNSNAQWGTLPQKITIDYINNADAYKINHETTIYLFDDTGKLFLGAKKTGSTISGTDLSSYYYIINKIKYQTK